MKKFALPAIAAALALSACDSGAEAPEATETAPAAGMESDTTVITPTATETVIADPNPEATATTDGSNVTIDGQDVDATVGEDGVEATVRVD
jgi:ABC-type Fe3+-hydroxamate transport system substrate-binding protein